AVAGLTDFPFELELEIAELVARDNVAGLPVFRERPVLDLPSPRHRVALEAAPGGERRAVEQGAPHRGLRCGGMGRMRGSPEQDDQASASGQQRGLCDFPGGHATPDFAKVLCRARARAGTLSPDAR